MGGPMFAAHLPRRRFTAAEVLRMVEAGILAEDDPLELIDGALIEMSPQGPLHRARTVLIRQLLESTFGTGFHVQDHSPVDAGPDSLPEPDVAVVRGEPVDYEDHHPTGADLALVVELSVTSQREDRAKAAVYARAGVVEYWHVDLVARRLVVHREPRPQDAEYAATRVCTDEDTVAVGQGTLSVAAMLPAR